ncbi:MAG: hypothetical protein ING59_10570 [Burkholderiales bacterium]|jgi:hypothetical protein|nr:hypothetical protein [Burkholderiales bacterium]
MNQAGADQVDQVDRLAQLSQLARAALTPFEVIDAAWWQPMLPIEARCTRVEVRRALRAAVLRKWAPEMPPWVGLPAREPAPFGLTPRLAQRVAPVLAAGLHRRSLSALVRGAEVREVRGCWGAEVVDCALALSAPPLEVPPMPTPWRLVNAADLAVIGRRLLHVAVAQLPAPWAARLRLRLPPDAADRVPAACPAPLAEALAQSGAAAAGASDAWWSWLTQAILAMQLRSEVAK